MNTVKLTYLLLRGAKYLRARMTGTVEWKDIEQFEESWKQRIKEMAQFICPHESVLDLGCGKMWLKDFLKDNEYFPVDYVARDKTTIIANFNKRQFPKVKADVTFVSGALEYVIDCEWFVESICEMSRKCILSYCTIESYPNIIMRRKKAWKNSLSRDQVVALFARKGMRLNCESVALNNHIFLFTNVEKKPT